MPRRNNTKQPQAGDLNRPFCTARRRRTPNRQVAHTPPQTRYPPIWRQSRLVAGAAGDIPNWMICRRDGASAKSYSAIASQPNFRWEKVKLSLARSQESRRLGLARDLRPYGEGLAGTAGPEDRRAVGAAARGDRAFLEHPGTEPRWDGSSPFRTERRIRAAARLTSCATMRKTVRALVMERDLLGHGRFILRLVRR